MSDAALTEKKTSWTELYFDLVFVLAIAQVAHVVADHPGWRSVLVGVGLFGVLWWTWIGFAVFYNRYGDEGSARQRLVLIAATVPCGLAAVAVSEIAHGSRTAFTLSLVAVRVLLALVHLTLNRPGMLPRRIAIGYAVTAAALVVSVFLPAPWWWVLWLAVFIGESVTVFASGTPRKLTRQELAAAAKDWRKSMGLARPTDPEFALNVPHLAERFGLFIIIVLGEVIVSAGRGLVGGDHVSWPAVTAVLVIGGALWWIYFDTAAATTERLLAMSGGAPQVARSAFAIGQMFPAFALVVLAAGLQLLLGGHDEAVAYWFVSVGLGVYVMGVRADVGQGAVMWLRMCLYVATFLLGLLGSVLAPLPYLWVVCAWAIACAYAASVGGRALKAELAAA